MLQSTNTSRSDSSSSESTDDEETRKIREAVCDESIYKPLRAVGKQLGQLFFAACDMFLLSLYLVVRDSRICHFTSKFISLDTFSQPVK